MFEMAPLLFDLLSQHRLGAVFHFRRVKWKPKALEKISTLRSTPRFGSAPRKRRLKLFLTRLLFALAWLQLT